MGAEPQPSRSPLKLTLSSLPSQPSEPPGILTPPLQPMASVPFLWEEAPGKPRAFAVATSSPASKSKAARCLDLPPRLLITTSTTTAEVVVGNKMTNTPSPTTVLDGPYCSSSSSGGARHLSHTMSFTFRKASFRKGQIGKEIRGKFSSLRWDLQEESNYDCESGGVLDFSPSAGDFVVESFATEPKIAGTRKRGSFFGSTKSNFWTSIYESVKQAVPWRRRQEKTRRMNYSYSIFISDQKGLRGPKRRDQRVRFRRGQGERATLTRN